MFTQQGWLRKEFEQCFETFVSKEQSILSRDNIIVIFSNDNDKRGFSKKENVSRAIPFRRRLLFRSQRKSFPSRSDFRRHFPSIHQSSTLYSPGDAETFLSEERSFETSKAGKNLEPMIHAQITKPIFEHVTDNRIQANFRYFPIRRPTDFSLLRSIVSIESINCTLTVFCFLFSKTFDRVLIGRCIRMCLLQKG